MKIFSVLLLVILLTGTISAQVPGENLFDDQLHEIYLYFDEPDYWDFLVSNKSLDDAFNTSTFISATAIVDGSVLDSIGVQLRGHSSYDDYPGDKKPFQLSFDEYVQEQKYDGIKSLNLDNFYLDPTFVRQKLFLSWMNENNIYAPRANYARLYLNDVYWGLYLMAERVNKTFCDIRFSNNDGNLYKGDHLENKCANLKHHNQLTDYYNCYELKTNEDVNDWSDLVNLTSIIANTSNAEFYDSLEKYLNTKVFIANWVAYNLFADVDAYPYAYQHNYYLYHNLSSGKFEWIEWDVNVVLGVEKSGNNNLQELDILELFQPENDKPLCKRMLDNPEYRHQYLQTYCELASYAFNPMVFDSTTAAWRDLIHSSVYDDTLNMFANSDFDVSLFDNIQYLNKTIPALFPFILQRSASVLSQLNALGYDECSIPTEINEGHNSDALIFPNPFDEYIKVHYTDFDQARSGEIAVYDLMGQLFFRRVLAGNNNIVEMGRDLTSGSYLIEITHGFDRRFIHAIKK